MRAIPIFAFLLMATPCGASTGLFKAEAEAFAGQAIVLDPRLPVPACSGGFAFAWRSEAQSSVVARCASTAWTMILPVAAAQRASSRSAPPVVRRGQPVQVMVGGNGFRVLAEGIAERDGRAGERIAVRNIRSGRRMVVDIEPDGAIVLTARADAAADRP